MFIFRNKIGVLNMGFLLIYSEKWNFGVLIKGVQYVFQSIDLRELKRDQKRKCNFLAIGVDIERCRGL